MLWLQETSRWSKKHWISWNEGLVMRIMIPLWSNQLISSHNETLLGLINIYWELSAESNARVKGSHLFSSLFTEWKEHNKLALSSLNINLNIASFFIDTGIWTLNFECDVRFSWILKYVVYLINQKNAQELNWNDSTKIIIPIASLPLKEIQCSWPREKRNKKRRKKVAPKWTFA